MLIETPLQPLQLTYCANVHPLEQPQDLQLYVDEILPRLKAGLSTRLSASEETFALGLYFPQAITKELLRKPETLKELGNRFLDCGARALTANAFPFGGFHATAVKEAVYRPDWQKRERLEYTMQVADVLAALPMTGSRQTISTLPGSFKSFPDLDQNVVAENFLRMVVYLAQLEADRGRWIQLAVEPEPGCLFETIDEWISFYENQILSRHWPKLGGNQEELIRRHLGTCFDCCHQAVEFEDCRGSLSILRKAGIPVAKMQLSNALRLESPGAHREALDDLANFVEKRYLHQTMALNADGKTAYFNDLPDYLAMARDRQDREVRIHFHVPLFLSECGNLGTTQDLMRACLDEVVKEGQTEHLEIETYSWNVMPERRKPDHQHDLMADVLREYDYILSCFAT